MMLVPAAMFAMFYFLSQYVQNVMGFSPLRDRLRVPAVQRRHRGRGDHLLEADGAGRPALAGRRRHRDGRARRSSGSPGCPTTTRSPSLSVDAHYVTDILPFIVLMSLGMGMDVRPADADRRARGRHPGLGHRVRRAEHDAAGRRRARPGRPVHGGRALHLRQGRPPWCPRPRRPPPPAAATRPRPSTLETLIGNVAFTEGATQAFLAGAR